METNILPYYGFILHFGYAEKSYASTLMVHHTERGFNTLKEAIQSISNFLLSGYLSEALSLKDGWGSNYQIGEYPYPTLKGFIDYLRELPSSQAVEGMVWDPDNLEEWWPWDLLNEQVLLLHKYWENNRTYGAEDILPRYLDLDKINKKFHVFESFIQELKDNMELPPPEGGIQKDRWEEMAIPEKNFNQVVLKGFRI